MYRLPGLSHRVAAVVADLAGQHFFDWNRPIGWPRKLSLPDALHLTLCRLRRHATHHDLCRHPKKLFGNSSGL